MVKAFRFAQVFGPNIFHFLLGAKMLRHIRDVLNEDVHRPIFFSVLFILLIHSTRAACLLSTA